MAKAAKHTSPAPASNKRAKRSRSDSFSPSPKDSDDKPLISLDAFISNFFFGIAVQDDDDIFEFIYDRNYSRDVVQSGNGDLFNFQTFRDFVTQFRKDLIDRKLISQSFVVVPDDAEGRDGDVAHTVKISGIRQGRHVELSIVSVLKIAFDKKKDRRLIKTESFVLAEEQKRVA